MKRLKTETAVLPHDHFYARGLEEFAHQQPQPQPPQQTVYDRAFTAFATLLALDKRLDSLHARLDATRGQFKRESHVLLGHLDQIFSDQDESSVVAKEHATVLPTRTLQSQSESVEGRGGVTDELLETGTVEVDDMGAQVRGEWDNHQFLDSPEFTGFLVDIYDHLEDDAGGIDGMNDVDDNDAAGAQGR